MVVVTAKGLCGGTKADHIRRGIGRGQMALPEGLVEGSLMERLCRGSRDSHEEIGHKKH